MQDSKVTRLILYLIAGIREGFYDDESLASYLLYRLNVLHQKGLLVTHKHQNSENIINSLIVMQSQRTYDYYRRGQRQRTTFMSFLNNSLND